MKDDDILIRVGNAYLTVEQAISYARLKRFTDYIEALDYDYIDWLEWLKLHKN